VNEAERFQKLDRLFQEVCDLPEADRHDRLVELAPDDEPLRSEVLELLRAESEPSRGVTPEEFQSGISRVLAESAAEPVAVGSYKILRKLGEGGMGVVYEAEQENPKRTVALKLLKPGLATPELIRRFEFEAKALGRLHHDGIAHIYEAGVSDSVAGPQPYFAMELVDGASLREWAKRSNASIKDRLKLIAFVCDAVQHAHTKGVLHRDLKPTNILVTKSGLPKVLDFGVARTVEQGEDEGESQYTKAGQLVGTVPYMSPEQLRGVGDEVDTRSDVYSLGVVMYELMSGELPNNIDGLGLVDAAKEIQDRNAAKLSTYNTRFRGDIETIVSTALAKEKSARYQTVAALADDIRRYLADETILARPQSAVYQMSRFAKRNKLLVGVTAGLVVAMVLGIAGTTFGIFRANTLTVLAEQRLIESERSLDIAEEVTNFLNNDVLAAVAPSALGHKTTVREALDAAAGKIDERFEGSPATKAAISNNIGNVYFVLGEFAEAERLIRNGADLFRNTLGQKHSLTLWAERDLGMLLRDTGQYEESADILNALLERAVADLGPSDELSLDVLVMAAELRAYTGDYVAAREMLDLYQERRKGVLPDDDSGVLTAYMAAATLDLELGRPDLAEQSNRKIHEIRYKNDGPDSPRTLVAEHNLATSLEALGRYDEALPLYKRVYEVEVARSGADHPDILVTAHNLAYLYQNLGRFDEAEPLMRDTLERCRKVFGPNHPGTLTCTNSMASLLREIDRLSDAEALLRPEYERLSADPESTVPLLVELGSTFAVVLTEQEKLDEAELVYESTISMMRSLYVEAHPNLGRHLIYWGGNKLQLGEPESAEPLLLEAYEILTGLERADMATQAARKLAAVYSELERPEDHSLWLERSGDSPAK
jgi:serine/threonine protein kinase